MGPDFQSAFYNFITGKKTAPLPTTSILATSRSPRTPPAPARITPEKLNQKETPKTVPLAKPVYNLTPKTVPPAKPNDNLTPRTIPSAKPNYNLTPKTIPSTKPNYNFTPKSVPPAKPNDNLTPKTVPSSKPNYNLMPKTVPSSKPNYILTPKTVSSAQPNYKFVDSKKVQQKSSVTETIDIDIDDELTDGVDLFGKPTNRKNFFDQDFDSDSSNTKRLNLILGKTIPQTFFNLFYNLCFR